jgi:hypothetical protein
MSSAKKKKGKKEGARKMNTERNKLDVELTAMLRRRET